MKEMTKNENRVIKPKFFKSLGCFSRETFRLRENDSHKPPVFYKSSNAVFILCVTLIYQLALEKKNVNKHYKMA